MAKSGHKGISRIDCPERKTVGWYVRVRLNKVTKSKFISDSLHGGREAGLEKAVECRNRLEQELGKPRTDWVVVGGNPRNKSGGGGVRRGVEKARTGWVVVGGNPRNKSGVVGVRRAVKKYKGKDGTVYLNEVYQVS